MYLRYRHYEKAPLIWVKVIGLFRQVFRMICKDKDIT